MKNHIYLFVILSGLFQINESYASEKAATQATEEQRHWIIPSPGSMPPPAVATSKPQPIAHPTTSHKVAPRKTTSHKNQKKITHLERYETHQGKPKKVRASPKKSSLFSYPVPVTEQPQSTKDSLPIKP